MHKRAEMLIVDHNPVLIMLSGNCNLKRLMSLDGISTMTFLGSPVLVLEMISDDHVLLRTNADVQHNIIARLQSCSALKVELKTERRKNILISAKFSFSYHQVSDKTMSNKS